ncbi:hypothetical protein [Pseudomonas fluorescens]|uniref:Uncharacterized protein n=1 Tax=Pseudomonas fluorescens TaxID=294 RepID=A0A944DJL8_PSEFL|nr:hypothetical protein [Pseudomonas fluorescens]MBT2308707.1 hypothetical protein [Pseudomonas fluorescens]MBT2327979.1 hypothetical protein [Pseudomonas fluorescens]MBT2348548.1 hypothetical protein [Pseudomonas fluorescens]MBT2354374.1 hypothetical protein [Pseudomonas fluorescens]
MSEQGLYQKVGQLLLDAGPSEAQKIVVRARLFAGERGQIYLLERAGYLISRFPNKSVPFSSYFPSSEELVERAERVLASGDMEKSPGKRGQIYLIALCLK